MPEFRLPQHRAVAAALRAMDHDLLTQCRCWFGGGTEIVLGLDEYRVSQDIDFLCADAAGYRELRERATLQGAAGLFAPSIRAARGLRHDQYGIRGYIIALDQPLRFEIVREARIALDGEPDIALGVPRLAAADRVAEKLLANADRCQDRATACRDAIDLGMLALRRGPLPAAAFAKAEAAYGADIARKLAWVVAHLSDEAERRRSADALGMTVALVTDAIAALAAAIGRPFPPPERE